MHQIQLNDYEVANLRALIEACGYGRITNRVERNPLYVANTGDWIGQVWQKLPDVDYPPNATPEQLAARANYFDN
mgnify:CR=1 FL=1